MEVKYSMKEPKYLKWYSNDKERYIYNFEDIAEYHINSHVFLHNIDGPALVYKNGNIFYFKHGKFHREDGPAAILSDKNILWYLNGIYYSFSDYLKELENYVGKTKIFALRLKYS